MDMEEDAVTSEDELITSQKVLENIEKAWINEKFAPEILPSQTEMLELMLGQIAHIEENIKKLDKNDLRFIAHKMELERIRFIMASYYRCRIRKIEQFTKHILMEEDSRELDKKRLSEEELKYAEEYHKHVEQYLQQIALKHVPSIQRSDNERIVKPNLFSHVFVKSNVSGSSLVLAVDDDEVDLATGSQHIIPYNLVSDLILKDSVQLI